VVRLLPAVGGALALWAAARLVKAAWGVPSALGADEAEMQAAARRSPHAVEGRFANTEPSALVTTASLPVILGRVITRGRAGRPSGPVPLVPGAPEGAAGALAVTWFGHSSVLLEIDGHRVLADPMWSERASPSPTIGPRRLHPIPTGLERLPTVDAVLISHDHYDHLDKATVTALADLSAAPFVVPLGLGGHLRRWGVPATRVVELDWGGTTRVAGLTLTCVECRHFSGRRPARNTTQWSAWALAGPAHRAYFGGDTGYTAAFARTGAALGPFDLTLLPIGAYADLWPDVHMNPEEAVLAHLDLRGGLLVPVHWATFDLGFHPWAEPVRRLLAAAGTSDVRIALPRPGQRVDALAPDGQVDWWSRLG
jgi:L-ascorbate metabolism protein UlaG (beta-lactamase superfamily)